MNKKADHKDVCREQVFSDLFTRYAGDLHDYLYYKYGEENHPSDIVQSAFQKLWENCKNVVPGKARSFLFTVANNEMLNAISRKKTVLNYRLEKPEMQSGETPQFLMEEKEYHDRLQQALASLTEEQRVTFMLNRVEGKKHQEIAEMLGISKKAVEKRIYTALAILRKKVDLHGK